MEQPTKRRLAAILMADVVGYSRLMGRDEDETIERLKAYRQVFADHVGKGRGRIVNTPGDAILAEFASVVDSVAAAADIQQELAERNGDVESSRRMLFRIGINLGEVVVEEGAIYGDGVNVAARLESLAEPGGICISGTVHANIENKLPYHYEFIGRQEVKNIDQPIPTFRVLTQPGAASHRVLRAKRGQHDSEPPEIPDRPSVAVLPFTNMSGDPEQEYFSDGITEDLITDLSKLRGLHVTARNSAFVFKWRSVDLREVARELGVRHVLEGSVRRSGQRLRITAQLIDTRTGDHLWAERYDRELQDVFDLQDEITRAIVTELDVKLAEGDVARVWRRSTTSHEAYDLFLKGVTEQRKYTRNGQVQAKALFEQALENDRRFAVAMAMFGMVHCFEAMCGWSEAPQASLDEALKLVDRALAVDDSLGHAHSILGFLFLWRGEHDRAIAAFERGVDLDQTDRSRMFLGLGLCFVERAQEALRIVEEAIMSNTYSPAWYKWPHAIAYFCAGHPEQSIETLGNLPELAPPERVFLALAYQSTSQFEEARHHAREVLRGGPHFSSDVFFNAFKNPNERARLIALARAAGLP